MNIHCTSYYLPTMYTCGCRPHMDSNPPPEVSAWPDSTHHNEPVMMFTAIGQRMQHSLHAIDSERTQDKCYNCICIDSLLQESSQLSPCTGPHAFVHTFTPKRVPGFCSCLLLLCTFMHALACISYICTPCIHPCRDCQVNKQQRRNGMPILGSVNNEPLFITFVARK